MLRMYLHFTEVRFASFLSSGFTTIAVINQPEKKPAKRTSVIENLFNAINFKP